MTHSKFVTIFILVKKFIFIHFLVSELERGKIKLLENDEKEKMIEYSFFLHSKIFCSISREVN